MYFSVGIDYIDIARHSSGCMVPRSMTFDKYNDNQIIYPVNMATVRWM